MTDTVAFVQEWLANADYDPTQFDKDFAAAIDARCKAASEDGATGLLREAAKVAHRALYNLQLAVVQSSPPDVMRAMLAGAKEAEFGIRAALAASPTDATGAGKMRERCAQACEDQAASFLSPQYATGQPLSSFQERFACQQCADAIRNLPVAGETL